MSGATGKDGVRLLDAHARDLAASGIAAEQAIAAGIYSVTAEEASDLLGFPVKSGGYVITYPGTEAFRVRLDVPHAFPDGRTAKYLVSGGSESRLYMTDRCRRALSAELERRVVFTEGGKKALALSLHTDEIVIGLPGVWNWRTKKSLEGVISDLLELVPLLHKREVVIAFDSDAREKVGVTQAAAALADWLRDNARARVQWAFPAPAPDGSKQGMDDLLVAEGVGAVADILDQAFSPVEPISYVVRQRLRRVGGDEKREFVGGALFRELTELIRQAPRSHRNALCEEVRKALGITIQDRSALRDSVLDGHELRSAEGEYEAGPDGLIWHKPTQNGSVAVRLTNFRARIVGDVLVDDGVEQVRRFEIEVELKGRKVVFTIAVGTFAGLGWVHEHLGADAVVFAGFSTKDHTRVAIQLLSPEPIRRRIYTHTGWRKIDGRWHYLHGGGALGGDGAVEHVEVELPGPLQAYVLPPVPGAEELRIAVRASLSILKLAPDHVTIPLLALVYRAALALAKITGHLTGATGAGKTQLAALLQQHFGGGMDAEHLPGSWSSTANALEELAFHAKDALFVVDDFVAVGGAHDASRLHREADRLLRAQANQQGRHRMRADMSLRAARPPRGSMLSTGEDVPRGRSLRARLAVITVGNGELDFSKLTELQQLGGSGVFSQAMAGFIRSLADDYDEILQEVRVLQRQLRGELAKGSMHKRTPDNVASLAVGWHFLLRFAKQVGAVDDAELAKLQERGRAAFRALAEAQAEHLEDSEPATMFVRQLSSALSSRRCHVADEEGDCPPEPGTWGWFKDAAGEWRPMGNRIGWLSGDDLYLDSEASIAAVRRLGRETGEEILFSPRTLKGHLRDQGLLVSVGDRGGKRRHEIRKTLEGSSRPVLHLRAKALFGRVAKVANSPENPEESSLGVGHSDGHSPPPEPGVANASVPSDGGSESEWPLWTLAEGKDEVSEGNEVELGDDEVEL